MEAAGWAFLAVLLAAPLTVRPARSIGLVSRPRADRWGRRAVPAFGGAAIVLGLLVGLFVLPGSAGVNLGLLAGIVVLFGTGVVDDLANTRPSVRVLIQVMAGVIFALALDSPDVATVAFAAVASPLAANATNIVDNSDGLAAALSATTAGALGTLALLVSPQGAGIAWVVVGCCVAFLVYNLPPARMFMGDAGTLPLGFALAAVATVAFHHHGTGGEGPFIALAALVSFSVQLGDLVMVVLTRLARGISPFSGGTDHTAHRLMRAGFSPFAMLLTLVALGVVATTAVTLAASVASAPARLLLVLAPVMLIAAFQIVVLVAAGQLSRDEQGRSKCVS